jgi:predicted ATP-grasp superfamily ATP-dependent carboligase
MCVIVIAISGRALAQSAAKMGWPVQVLDVFADRDTKQVANAQVVGRDGVIALDHHRLFDALDRLRAPASETLIVIGSGLERSPAWLERLAEYGTLCTNPADVVAAFKDPELSAELLRSLGFQVPLTQRQRPENLDGWLRKDIGGAGGIHVRRADIAPGARNAYYQHEVAGVPMSATFLADAERAYLLGYNAQRFQAIGEAPFCYAGAAMSEAPPDDIAAAIEVGLNRLVRVSALRGLNGLDFMLNGSQMNVLEVNTRPTATFELYEPDFPEGLVHWHVESFKHPLSNLAERLQRPRLQWRAYAIVYAEQAISMVPNVAFPEGCRDIPNAGAAIDRGAPVCSLFAQADTAHAARQELQRREQALRELLYSWTASASALAEQRT